MAGLILDRDKKVVKDSQFKPLSIGNEVVFLPYGEDSLFKGTIVKESVASIYVKVFDDNSNPLHVRKINSSRIYKL